MKLYAISDVHGCFSKEDMDFMDKLFNNLMRRARKSFWKKLEWIAIKNEY